MLHNFLGDFANISYAILNMMIMNIGIIEKNLYSFESSLGHIPCRQIKTVVGRQPPYNSIPQSVYFMYDIVI